MSLPCGILGLKRNYALLFKMLEEKQVLYTFLEEVEKVVRSHGQIITFQRYNNNYQNSVPL